MFVLNNSPPSEQERFLQRRLVRLYDATKPELCFYVQDPSGYPSNPPQPVSTTINGQTFYPQVVRDYVVEEDRGLRNKTVEDMLGHPSYRFPCKNCGHFDPQAKSYCACDYETWAKAKSDFWMKHLNIQKLPGKGFCLLTRKTIPARTVIGEYYGELVSSTWSATAEESSYWVSIPCGMPRKNGKGGQKLCRVDSCRKGSALRFLSHSCKPNAQLVRGRIGSGRYVIAAEALDQDIQPGQEICIDYGDGWFEKDEFCLCGHAECRKPPPKQ